MNRLRDIIEREGSAFRREPVSPAPSRRIRVRLGRDPCVGDAFLVDPLVRKRRAQARGP